MSLWNKIVDFAGGSIVESIVDTAKAYFPPSMTEQEKGKMEMAIRKTAHKQELAMLHATNHMEAEFNQRIKDMEGTAKDLKAIPFIGPVVIFLRGLQRPLWGFGTMVMDYFVFSGLWKVEDGTQASAAFLLINFLVLGFLFGERAIKNVAPLIERLLKK